MKWLDRIPMGTIAVMALLMGLAPFWPQPHLLEKLRMLMAGQLARPIDIFDLFWHGLFPLLLVVKLIRGAQLKREDRGK